MGFILSADAEGQGDGWHFVMCWAHGQGFVAESFSSRYQREQCQTCLSWATARWASQSYPVTSHAGGQDSVTHLLMSCMDLCLIRA